MLRSTEFYSRISIATILGFLFIVGIWSYRCHRYGDIVYLIIAFVVLDYIGKLKINIFAERFSEGWVFSWCPKCKYENIKLTSTCKNCGYSKKVFENIEQKPRREKIFADSFTSLNPLFQKRLSLNALENLQLDEDEVILATLKVNIINGIYIDDTKSLCSFITITNKNLIFLEMLSFQRGWRLRNKIRLTSIADCCAAKKKIGPADRKVVRFTANGIVYEFFLWVFDKSEDEHHKYAQKICAMISQHKYVQQGLGP